LVFWRSRNRENPNRLPVEEKCCLRASCVCLSCEGSILGSVSVFWKAYPIYRRVYPILYWELFWGNSRCLSWGNSWESTRRTTLCF
jgi:hypothetical protein